MCALPDLLSEIDSRRERLDTLRLLDQESIRDALLVEYTYESNRIEGNTLTLRETDLVIHKGLTVGGKSMREHLEAINHNQAVLFLLDFARGLETFSERILKDLHGLVLHGIDRDNAGRFRTVPVLISGSRHVPPQAIQVPSLVEELFRDFPTWQKALHPVVLAAEVHERIATIHPFTDGNGRTARLCMNLLLLRAGYPLANIPGDTESRRRYYDALEACNLGKSKEDFHRLVAEQVLASAKRLLELVG
jgi:Fic family protein